MLNGFIDLGVPLTKQDSNLTQKTADSRSAAPAVSEVLSCMK
ncbi:hypothetical protein CHCC14814_0628 [Bacillus paralicheniformis]|nr:hypothetical protein CHCC14814_0628 [Bacillus paralicheniformis]